MTAGMRPALPQREPSRPRLLVLAAVLGMTTMCATGHSEARRAADRFLALYYDKAHVKDALELCTGHAKTRLEFEIKVMRGARPGDEIHASFQPRHEKFPTRDAATYVYEVDLGRAGARPLFARLQLINADGKWLVSEFDEKERATAPQAAGAQ